MQMAMDAKILELENEFWESMKANNTEAALKLSADPCLVAGSQGVARIKKKDFAKMMSEGNWKLLDFHLDDVKFEQISDDVAVICYKVHEDLTVDGKPVSLDAADTSTWVRKNGNWVCAMHSESIIGDPFGRDRKAVN